MYTGRWEVATDGKIPYGDIDDLRIIGAKMDPGDPLVYIGNLPGDVPQVFRELIGNYLQWKPLLRPPLRLAQEALDAYIDAHPTSMVFHSSPLPNQIAIATSLITGSDSNSAVAELFRGYDFLTDAEINLLSESQQDFFRGGLYHIRRQRYLKAVSYFQQSEFAQQPLTQRLLGLCHQLMDDDVGAFMCFKRSAVSDGKGKFLLAWCFDHEYGTERDEEAAFIWYKSSAAQGVIEAATTLRDSRWIKYMNDALDQDFDGLALGWLGNIFKPEALYYEVFVENIHDAAESGNSDARYFLVWANSLRVIIKNNCEAFRNYMDADLCLRLIHAAISGNKFAQNEIQQSLFPMDTSMMPKLDPGQHALVEVLEKLTFPTESDPTPLFPPGLRRVSRSKKSKRSFFAAGQLARCYQLGIGVSQDFSKALDLYRMAAAAGDTYAQWQIGNCYYHGIGIEKDVIEAFRWIYKAAHAGLVLAWCDLGDMYAQGVGTKRDDEKAFAYYLRAAQAGKINAIRSVGFCYLNGQGVGRKLNEWFLWISLAAHAGDAQAMCNVGNCYANGNEGVEKNNVEAFRWFSKAARLGNTHAMHNMGLCYLNGIGVEKNENEGFQWVFKATEAGLSEAQYNLGICYAKGKGITQDSKKAFQCFVKATNAGVIEARYNLGLCYEIGDGTGKNYGKAFQCFFKAAKAGKREAMHSLGVCYQDGRGIDKDENEAFWWFSKASEAGLAEADCSLGVCYEKGKGTNKDYYMAFDYYFKATQAEDLTAMHCLGNCYFNGKGVTKDELEAFQWFLKAAEAGFSPSQGMVGNCYWSGIGVEENKSIANEWYLKSAYGGDAHAMFCIADSYENGTGVQKDLVEARRWYMESAQKGDEEAKSALMRFDLQHFALFPT